MENKIKIQVLGSGCFSCKKLFELTQQAVRETGLNAEVEYITDLQKIIDLGLMQMPVLTINGKPVMTGSAFDIEKITGLIKQGDCAPHIQAQKKCGCNCGGNC